MDRSNLILKSITQLAVEKGCDTGFDSYSRVNRRNSIISGGLMVRSRLRVQRASGSEPDPAEDPQSARVPGNRPWHRNPRWRQSGKVEEEKKRLNKHEGSEKMANNFPLVLAASSLILNSIIKTCETYRTPHHH
ncbi:hypothetical protein AVEN_106338-1 [Araneus ventricosus]|uniref:Uncharacterized protein n=1 Tax=Araneus ventricosus TaxID=182803 RepID=A0A4Y2ASM0_ARAVE|nr:hypothetical protein AVEN_106338-1 [Araneus ventricosus]